VLEALGSPSLVGGARYNEARDASGVANMTFKRALDGLINRGLVRVEGPPHSKDRRYHVTEAGELTLTPSRVSESHQSTITVPPDFDTLPNSEYHSTTVPPPF